MNVWLWGPSLWSVFHGSAQMSDQDESLRKPFNVMAHSLRQILPCIQCKNSYNVFLDELGMPSDGLFLEWTHRLHNRVNEKLEIQRIEKLQAMSDGSISETVWDTLKKASSRNVLQNAPSLEVVTKRCILNGDNPWTEMQALTILVVLNMHAGPDAAKVPDDVSKALQNFTTSLIEMHQILGAPTEYIKFLKSLVKMSVTERVSVLGRRMQPGHSASDIQERLRLFRAGACLNGTCS